MDKKTDLRIIKTKKNLYEALEELMEKKSFEEIKISEICETAMINRSTFYSHFEDKYELLNSLINDLRKELKDEIEQDMEYIDLKDFYMKTIDVVLNHLEKKKDIYHKMMNNNRNSVAMDMIYDIIKESIQTRMSLFYKGKIPVDLLSSFYIGGIFNVLLKWIQNPTCKREELEEYLEKMFIYE